MKSTKPKRKAEIQHTVIGTFYYNLIGDNGQVLVSSEGINQKANVLKVLKKYFSDFKIVDKTKGVKFEKQSSLSPLPENPC